MPMLNFHRDQAGAAISPYRRSFLRIYDRYVLDFSFSFLWACPSTAMQEMYNRYMTLNHLDIGVGTGYFVEHCNLCGKFQRLALMDLRRESLDAASSRLSRYRPETYQGNILDAVSIKKPGFDSIAMMNLLHCLPGNIHEKSVAFDNVMSVLNPGGVIFGSTILYRGVKPNTMAKMVMKYYNRMGYMENTEDYADSLRESLATRFSRSAVRIEGCVALFHARKRYT